MNSLELVNKLYKPYRITKQGKATIIYSIDGKFVVKEKSEKNVKELFDYLKYRNFNCIPKLIDDTRSDINIYEYIEDVNIPKDQKALDLIKVVANLHNKTSYNKEVREDKYKEIYDEIKGNLNYYKQDYENIVKEIENHIFMSPSEYLFIRNSSKLLNQVAFCSSKLDEWYETVKNKRSSRVSLVHNNLSLDHYLKGEKEALISWDKSKYDSPILDIYNFYNKEALNLEFTCLLEEYFKDIKLDKSEKDLLLILLCMPKKIEFQSDEFTRTKNIVASLDYVYKTEYLVRPYYSVDNKEE